MFLGIIATSRSGIRRHLGISPLTAHGPADSHAGAILRSKGCGSRTIHPRFASGSMRGNGPPPSPDTREKGAKDTGRPVSV